MKKKPPIIYLGLILLFLLGASTMAFAAERVTFTQADDGSSITWRIDEPNVRQHITHYQNIRFAEGDQVTVTAGGCVQTGGTGGGILAPSCTGTWKLYVNPQGCNSERQYHGLMLIPGATAGLETIASVMARSPVVVPRFPPNTDSSQRFLKLGYEDDNYDDNRYEDRQDHGSFCQCRGVSKAWIEITIVHGTPPSTPPPCPPKPFDLYWTDLDANMLPFNPGWGVHCGQEEPLQHVDPGPLCNFFRANDHDVLNLGSNCTRALPTVDEKVGATSYLCVPFTQRLGIPCTPGPPGLPCLCRPPREGVWGHVNFGYATFKGTLTYIDWEACGVPWFDCDLNLRLLPQNRDGTPTTAAMTQGNNHEGIQLEFDGRETVRMIPAGVLPWWRDVAQLDNAHRRRVITGREGIAIGQLGLDVVHPPEQTEVHPVLGLAIHVSSSPTEEVWAIMGRRSGNEGACSTDSFHLLHDTGLGSAPNFHGEMRFDLGPVPSISGATTQFKRVWSGGVGDANFMLESNENGTLLRVPLGPPGTVVFGELRLTAAAVGVRSASSGSLRVFRSLREAIAAAVDGDTVLLKPGAYTSDPTVTKRIRMEKWGTSAGNVVITQAPPPPPPPPCTPRCPSHGCGGDDGCGGECRVTCAGRCCSPEGPCVTGGQPCPTPN